MRSKVGGDEECSQWFGTLPITARDGMILELLEGSLRSSLGLDGLGLTVEEGAIVLSVCKSVLTCKYVLPVND